MKAIEWYVDYFDISQERHKSMLEEIQQFKLLPMMSLTLPVYNTKPSWLRECIHSVLDQVYTTWELSICDNGSNPETTKILEEYAAQDDRIKIVRLESNVDVHAAISTALRISTGEYVGLIDSDDVITPDALYRVVRAINRNPQVRMLYSDEVLLEGDKARIYIKPKFNHELLCYGHYIGHLVVYQTAFLRKLGLRHAGGSYDYDLALRASEQLLWSEEIYHIPALLYKYRRYATSTSQANVASCIAGGKQALEEHLARLKIDATVTVSPDGTYLVKSEFGDTLTFDLDMEEIFSHYSDYPFPRDHMLEIDLR